MTTSHSSGSQVRLLSIDGGGVRGLSALVLLEQIMDQMNAGREEKGLEAQEPWQVFDMIGGTSTGGLIAIMLGRLRMSVSDTMKAYMKLSEDAFTAKNLINRFAGGPLNSKFKKAPLEDAVKSIIGPDWETKLLKEDDGRPSCKVFVVSHQTGCTNTAEILRSYRNFKKSRATLDSMRIWQAARATSAALTFFDPIVIDGVEYRDGGLLYNNPVALVHSEASEVFPDKEQTLISIGTGRPTTKAFDPKLLTLAQELAKIATDTENAASDFHQRDNGRAAKSGRYFRFNVPEIGDKGLEESKPQDLTYLKKMTEKYMDSPDVGNKLEFCSQQLAQVRRVNVDPEKQSILHWVSDLDFSRVHKQYVADREEGTGSVASWIKSEYSSWFEGKRSNVWLKGPPGVGKSTLTSSLIEELESRRTDGTAIAFIYFDSSVRDVSTTSLIACLLRQIAQCRPGISDALRESHQGHTAAGTTLDGNECRLLLRTEVQSFEKVFIVLDALDRGERDMVLQLLQELHDIRIHTDNVKLLASSLEIPDFRLELVDPEEVEITARREEIEAFVRRRIQRCKRSSKLRKYTERDKELEAKICETILHKSQELFLVAKLLMNNLENSKARTKEQFVNELDKLRDFTDGLYQDLYEDLWLRIAEQDPCGVELASRIFSWVTFSKEPLTIETMLYGLRASEGATSLPFHEDEVTDEDEISTVCFGLITVKSETGTVGFVHGTAEQFFPGFLPTRLAVDPNYLVASACIHYLSLPIIVEDLHTDQATQLPLDRYAGLYWGWHAAQVSGNDMQEKIMRVLRCERTLLPSSRAARLLVAALWQDKEDILMEDPPDARAIHGIHLAAYFGLNEMVSRLVPDSEQPDGRTTCSAWTPLRWAMLNSKLDTVELLYNLGARLDIPDASGNTALMWAQGRRLTATRVSNLDLQECRLHIGDSQISDSFDWYYEEPTQLRTITPTSREILNFLVDCTADINWRNNAGQTALCIATMLYDEDMLLCHVRRGADLDTVDNEDMTALLRALQPPNDRVYQNIRISGNAKIHLGRRLHINSLRPSRVRQHRISERTILELIGSSNLDVKDAFGRTPLSLAAHYGLHLIVKKLLARGADPGSVDNKGATPLIWALRRPMRFRTVIQRLEVSGDARVLLGDELIFDKSLGISLEVVKSHEWKVFHQKRQYFALRHGLIEDLARCSKSVAHADQFGMDAYTLALKEDLPDVVNFLQTIDAKVRCGESVPDLLYQNGGRSLFLCDRAKVHHGQRIWPNGSRESATNWFHATLPWSIPRNECSSRTHVTTSAQVQFRGSAANILTGCSMLYQGDMILDSS